jgi:quercetin dioxygenase-like cupin family protein
MEAYDLHATLRSLPQLNITDHTTEADAGAAMRVLTLFNQCMVGMVSFSGETPWERHPDDEFLQVLEGEVFVTVLTNDGGVQETTLRAGSACVIPRGLWHKQRTIQDVKLLFVTSQNGNEASTSKDPRVSGS